MGKVLFWIVVLGAGWLAWSLIRVSQRKQERAQVEADEAAAGRAGPAKGKDKDKQGAEEIVACAHCGVYLPASSALTGKGGPYCCVEHRDAARG
jgi:uncharacterized protein